MARKLVLLAPRSPFNPPFVCFPCFWSILFGRVWLCEVHKMAGLDEDIVRSRVFVTSASTMHSILNVLRYGEGRLAEASEIDVNYLSHLAA